jgi:hypothetical protein
MALIKEERRAGARWRNAQRQGLAGGSSRRPGSARTLTGIPVPTRLALGTDELAFMGSPSSVRRVEAAVPWDLTSRRGQLSSVQPCFRGRVTSNGGCSDWLGARGGRPFVAVGSLDARGAMTLANIRNNGSRVAIATWQSCGHQRLRCTRCGGKQVDTRREQRQRRPNDAEREETKSRPPPRAVSLGKGDRRARERLPRVRARVPRLALC